MFKRVLIIVGIIILLIIIAFSIFLIYMGLNWGKPVKVEKRSITTGFGDEFTYKWEMTDFPDIEYDVTITHKKLKQTVGVANPDVVPRGEIDELLQLNNTNYYHLGMSLIIVDNDVGEMQSFSIEKVVNGEIEIAIPPEILSKCEEILSKDR